MLWGLSKQDYVRAFGLPGKARFLLRFRMIVKQIKLCSVLKKINTGTLECPLRLFVNSTFDSIYLELENLLEVPLKKHDDFTCCSSNRVSESPSSFLFLSIDEYCSSQWSPVTFICCVYWCWHPKREEIEYPTPKKLAQKISSHLQNL